MSCHLTQPCSHDVADPKVNRDYVKDFAAPEIYRTKILFETSIIPLD
jgi:hypothetical protein